MRTRQPAAPFQLLPDVQESQLAFVGSLGSERGPGRCSQCRTEQAPNRRRQHPDARRICPSPVQASLPPALEKGPPAKGG